MAEEGVIIAEDHWANPGRTLGALEDFLSVRTGLTVEIADLVMLTSVAELMQIVFGCMN